MYSIVNETNKKKRVDRVHKNLSKNIYSIKTRCIIVRYLKMCFDFKATNSHKNTPNDG